MWWNDNLDAVPQGNAAATPPVTVNAADRRRLAQQQIAERRKASRQPSQAKRAVFGYGEALPLEGLSGFLQGHEMANNWRYEQVLADEERARREAENDADIIEAKLASDEQYDEATKKEQADRRARELIKAVIGMNGVGQLNLDDPRVQDYLHSLTEGEFQKFLSDYHRASLPRATSGQWQTKLPTAEQYGLPGWSTQPAAEPRREFTLPTLEEDFRPSRPIGFGRKPYDHPY
jgi:hypothetical protein